MLRAVKNKISDIAVVRSLIQTLFMTGDSIRPIIQKPIVSKFIGSHLHRHVLDAGCGRGLYTRLLLKRARQVTALDYSHTHIETLKRRLGHLPHLSLCVGSADNLPFEDDKFDLVLHCEVLEHIQDDRKVLSELFRVLEPGGRLVLSVPVPPAPVYDAEHVREGYTLEEISQLLHHSGFEIVRYQYCYFNFSKQVKKLAALWRKKIKLPPPSFFLLPVYYEKLFKPSMTEKNLPYDLVIEAKK